MILQPKSQISRKKQQNQKSKSKNQKVIKMRLLKKQQKGKMKNK